MDDYESTFLEDDWDDSWELEVERFTYDWTIIAAAAASLIVGTAIMVAACYLIVMVGT